MKTRIALVVAIVLGVVVGGLGWMHWRAGRFEVVGGTVYLVQLKPVVDSSGKVKAVSKEVVEKAIAILRKRLDRGGSKRLILRPVDVDRIEIDEPRLDDGETSDLRDRLEETARLEFRLVNRGGGSAAGFVTLPFKHVKEGGEKELVVKDHPDFDGWHVKQTFATMDSNKGWMLILKFDEEGTKLFGDFTAAHIGDRLAIVVNGRIITAPTLNDALRGGSAEISGNFTQNEARSLAAALDNPLENPLVVLQVRTVGPASGGAASQ